MRPRRSVGLFVQHKKMKALDLMQNLKRREHRPAAIIAVAVTVYLLFVSCPQVLRRLHDVWQDIYAFGDQRDTFSSRLLSLAFSVTALLCRIADIAIWVLSIFISWAAFHKSRKKAYLFILAYVLMPLLLVTATWLGSIIFSPTGPYHAQNIETNPQQVQNASPSPAVVNQRITVPVGPFLLLAGLWYLYQTEETKNGQPAPRNDPPN